MPLSHRVYAEVSLPVTQPEAVIASFVFHPLFFTCGRKVHMLGTTQRYSLDRLSCATPATDLSC